MIDEQLQLAPYDTSSQNPKELFDIEDVEGKTELTSEQVFIVARLKLLGNLLHTKFNINLVNSFITDFLTLQISKDRGSRKEFVNAMQSENAVQSQSLLDKMSLNMGK